jgi:hypothetical protein
MRNEPVTPGGVSAEDIAGSGLLVEIVLAVNRKVSSGHSEKGSTNSVEPFSGRERFDLWVAPFPKSYSQFPERLSITPLCLDMQAMLWGHYPLRK